MDKLEIALQEEMQLRASIVEQPLEGLLYDLDLMPEQCKSGIANIRRIAVEVLRKEIERLRKDIIKHGQHTGDCVTHWMPCEEDCSCGWLKLQQALKEGK